jgi:LysM repeat protein
MLKYIKDSWPFWLRVFFFIISIKLLIFSLFKIFPIKNETVYYSEKYPNKNIIYADILKKNDIKLEVYNKYSLIGDELKDILSKNFKYCPKISVITYKVKRGDNIWKICKKFSITPNEFFKVNRLKTEVLYTGQVVNIPKYKSRVGLPENSINMLWPVNGWISSKFGPRIHPITKKWEFHNGIDIVADKNTPIKAAETGIVIFTGYKKYSGKTVIIQHIDGIATIYAHCNKILVKKGQYVTKGDIIARVGKTGFATGYHLHFSVTIYGTYVNPINYLKLYSEN